MGGLGLQQWKNPAVESGTGNRKRMFSDQIISAAWLSLVAAYFQHLLSQTSYQFSELSNILPINYFST